MVGMQELRDIWKNSWSRVWGYTKIGAGAFLLVWHEAFTYIGSIVIDPEVKSAIANMSFPAYVGLGLAILGCITLVARAHKDA